MAESISTISQALETPKFIAKPDMERMASPHSSFRLNYHHNDSVRCDARDAGVRNAFAFIDAAT